MAAQRTRQDQLAPANDGSRTLTLTANQSQPGSEGAAAGPSRVPEAGVLHLRGTGDARARVQWEEGTVDNEGLGRKKSKICCIYHKPKKFDESSDESDSSSSSCGSTDSRQRNSHRHSHNHSHHLHGPPDSRGANSEMASGARSGTEVEVKAPAPPNAYEKQPGKGKGRA